MSDNATSTVGSSAQEKRVLLAQLLKRKAATLKSAYPLSYNQRAMWFLYQLAPDSAAYNVAFAARICSQVDVQALVQAFQTLIDRHAVLRTTFSGHSGQPVQEVYGYRELHFEEIDASSWDENELNQQVVKAYQRPFDLERGPVQRVSLFTRSAEEHVLLLTVHHIVCDGWALFLLLDEFRVLYRAMREGSPAPLTPLSARYTDYVQWQTEMLAGAEGERLWSYWRQQLAGELPALDLPIDRPRPPTQTYQGDSHLTMLSEDLTRQLKALAKAEGATLFMVLLAAFQVLLNRYSGQEDILVGSPTFGRSRPEWAGLVGDFINTVVLRGDLAHNPTFTAFLSQVRETVLAAMAHQEYPFPLLVEQLQPTRDPSRSPLFQALFVLQQPQQLKELPAYLVTGQAQTELDFGGLVLRPFALAQQEGQFDLTLEMIETAGSILAFLKYNRDLFDASTIAAMAERFRTLLEGIASNPQRLVSDVPLLTESERQQLIVNWNQTQMDYPREQCVHQLFEAQAELRPQAAAVSFEETQLTYQELNERANQLARHLRQLGVGPDTLVGIFVERSVEMVVGLLGVLKAGGAYVPLDPAFPRDRLAFMLADSQAAVLLTQQRLVNDIPTHDDTKVICLDRDWPLVARQSSDNVANLAVPGNLAYVIYTSGSTGRPKGVQIPHQAVVNLLTSMRQEPGLTPEDILLSVTTLSFDIAVLEIFLPLTTGAQVVLVSRETAADGWQLIEAIEASRASVMQATPTTWRVLIEAGWSGNRQLKALCGGEALPRGLAVQLLQRTASLWNMYGPTETTVWSAVCHIQAPDRAVSIGHPIGNTQMYVLDRYLQPVPPGVLGELYIGGDGLARGYLNRPELTAQSFLPNPFNHGEGARLYKTGDLVRCRALGQIEFEGRIDHQIKIRGFRVELGEIEAVLEQHPQVRQAVAVARDDLPGGRALVAYLAVSQEARPTIMALRSHLQERLPDYMIPAAYVFLEALPLTPNGKVDRAKLPAPEQHRPELGEAYVAPGTPIEVKLAAIWAQALGVEKVGIHDSFFDLGGHSLLATQVVSRIRDTFHMELALRVIFETPTVAALSNLVERISPVLATAEPLGADMAEDQEEVIL